MSAGPILLYWGKYPEPEFVNLLRSPGIDSQCDGPVRQPYLTHRPARQHRLAESIPWNRFLGSLNFYKFGLCLLLYSIRCLFFLPYGRSKKSLLRGVWCTLSVRVVQNFYIFTSTVPLLDYSCTQPKSTLADEPGCVSEHGGTWLDLSTLHSHTTTPTYPPPSSGFHQLTHAESYSDNFVVFRGLTILQLAL